MVGLKSLNHSKKFFKYLFYRNLTLSFKELLGLIRNLVPTLWVVNKAMFIVILNGL